MCLITWQAGGGCKDGLSGWWITASLSSCSMLPLWRAGGCCKGGMSGWWSTATLRRHNSISSCMLRPLVRLDDTGVLFSRS